MEGNQRWFHHDIRSFQDAYSKVINHKNTTQFKFYGQADGHLTGSSPYASTFLVHRLDKDQSRFDNRWGLNNDKPYYGITAYLSFDAGKNIGSSKKDEFNGKMLEYLMDHDRMKKDYKRTGNESIYKAYAPIQEYFNERRNINNYFLKDDELPDNQKKRLPIIHIPIYRRVERYKPYNSESYKDRSMFYLSCVDKNSNHSYREQPKWDNLRHLIDYYSIGGAGADYLLKYLADIDHDRWREYLKPALDIKLQYVISNDRLAENCEFYHPNLTSDMKTTELLLNPYYKKGSFLLRPHPMKVDNYILSIKMSHQKANLAQICISLVDQDPKDNEQDPFNRTFGEIWKTDSSGNYEFGKKHLENGTTNPFQEIRHWLSFQNYQDDLNREADEEGKIKFKNPFFSSFHKDFTYADEFPDMKFPVYSRKFKACEITNKLDLITPKMIISTDDHNYGCEILDPKTKHHSWKMEYHLVQDKEELLRNKKRGGVLSPYNHASDIKLFKTGAAEKNPTKNRYKDILPYDHSRIILRYGAYDRLDTKKLKQGGDFTIRQDVTEAAGLNLKNFKAQNLGKTNNIMSTSRDYINANSISQWGNQGRGSRFIACQGPLAGDEGTLNPLRRDAIKEDTTLDIWRLLLSTNSDIIVMVAKCREKGKPKVARYWPELGKKKELHMIKPIDGGKQRIAVIETVKEQFFPAGTRDPYLPAAEDFDKEIPKATYAMRTIQIKPDYIDQIDGKRIHNSIALNRKDGRFNEAARRWKGDAFEVVQFQYFDWPDHGVPEGDRGLSGMIEFIEHLNVVNKLWENSHASAAKTKELQEIYNVLNADLDSFSGTAKQNLQQQRDRLHEIAGLQGSDSKKGKLGNIVVHCSAGVGRTGTFMALSMLFDQIKWYGLETELDVFEMVQKLRLQRPQMVQADVQYKFIYDCLNYYIQKMMSDEKRFVKPAQKISGAGGLGATLGGKNRFKSRVGKRAGLGAGAPAGRDNQGFDN